MAFLEVSGLKKSYAEFDLAMDLNANAGEIVVILGPSGSGKSTFLRLIAGLINPDSGRILLDGRDITPLPARQRGLGLMFQDFALFPHYNVGDNVAYGLRSQRPRIEKAHIEAKVLHLLKQFSLEGFTSRQVDGLSGGEKQRVALARALAVSPALMLFDEPLSSLDNALRKELRAELLILQRELGYTSISVTHDQEDALSVADRILLMRNGSLVQSGTPEELYWEAQTAFVAAFLGDANLLSARQLRQASPGFSTPLDDQLFLVRAEQIKLGTCPDGISVQVQVMHSEYQGRDYLVRAVLCGIAVEEIGLLFRMPQRGVVGEIVRVSWPVAAMRPVREDR